jgi:hypothetical protein
MANLTTAKIEYLINKYKSQINSLKDELRNNRTMTIEQFRTAIEINECIIKDLEALLIISIN